MQRHNGFPILSPVAFEGELKLSSQERKGEGPEAAHASAYRRAPAMQVTSSHDVVRGGRRNSRQSENSDNGRPEGGGGYSRRRRSAGPDGPSSVEGRVRRNVAKA